MHLTSSPFVSRSLSRAVVTNDHDDQVLRTLMEVDAPVRGLLLNHLCDGDDVRRQRLQAMVEAAVAWRERDEARTTLAGDAVVVDG